MENNIVIGYIRKIIPFSTVDGHGNRTAIFLQGCQFDCLYCHNPETISIVNQNSQLQGVTAMTVEAVMNEIEPYFPFISGITISGGECSVQGEFLLVLCKAFKNKNISVLIDTNGHMSSTYFNELAQVVSGFMFDVKAIFEEEHIRLTGTHNRRVLENLKMAAVMGKLYEVRTVIIPVILNNEQTVEWVSRFIVKESPETRYKLIRYRKHGVREGYLPGIDMPTDAAMQALEKLSLEIGVNNVILL